MPHSVGLFEDLIQFRHFPSNQDYFPSLFLLFVIFDSFFKFFSRLSLNNRVQRRSYKLGAMLGMTKKVILSDISPVSISDRSLVRANHSTRSVIQLTESGTRVQLGGGGRGEFWLFFGKCV